MTYSLIMTACANKEEVKAIIEELLVKKLAAFVQIKEVESFYTWRGKVENSAEVLVCIKTKHDLYKEVEKTILEKHSYETPEIIEIPITDGHQKYLNWIDEVTK